MHEIQSAYFGHEAFTLFTAACYIKGSNTDYNFKWNIDKGTGLTVISVVIVSNQTVHEEILHSHAMSCLLISSRIIFQVLKKYIFVVIDVAASLDCSMSFAHFLIFPEI